MVLGRAGGVVGADAGAAEDLVERLRVPAAVLPQVDRQHVDAEDLDQADHVLHGARRRGRRAAAAEIIGDQPQVVEQRAAIEVDSRGLGRASPPQLGFSSARWSSVRWSLAEICRHLAR